MLQKRRSQFPNDLICYTQNLLCGMVKKIGIWGLIVSPMDILDGNGDDNYVILLVVPFVVA